MNLGRDPNGQGSDGSQNSDSYVSDQDSNPASPQKQSRSTLVYYDGSPEPRRMLGDHPPYSSLPGADIDNSPGFFEENQHQDEISSIVSKAKVDKLSIVKKITATFKGQNGRRASARPEATSPPKQQLMSPQSESDDLQDLDEAGSQ